MDVVLVLTAVLVAAGIAERWAHGRALHSIPIRVHVNGTRGKSSVTRLIAAGLNGAGMRAVAKTTGSARRLILLDGHEQEVHRRGPANVREQLHVTRRAAQLKAHALVAECMAIEPELQRFLESHLMQSHVTVITNVRPDHREALRSSLAGAARRKGARVEVVRAVDHPSPQEMARFDYYEHPANVACALSVCRQLGVEREVALQGMGRVRPDPGALTWMGLSLAGRTVRFVNASAANDAEPTAAIFEHLHLRPDYERPLIVVLNARRDRPLRTVQLVGHLGSLLRADHYLVVGELSWAMKKRLAKLARGGLPLEVLGQVAPQKVQERIAALARAGSTVVGIGNIGGMGRALIELCAGMKKS